MKKPKTFKVKPKQISKVEMRFSNRTQNDPGAAYLSGGAKFEIPLSHKPFAIKTNMKRKK